MKFFRHGKSVATRVPEKFSRKPGKKSCQPPAGVFFLRNLPTTFGKPPAAGKFPTAKLSALK
jgi:hypothetical protein